MFRTAAPPRLLRPCRRAWGGARGAFTLIELLVVVVILTILASLSLAGLAGARQRSKIDKTRSTIRKIDAVIRPMYDSYRTRRVSTATSGDRLANASNLLVAKRLLMVREMPDTWDDVASVITASQPATAKAYTRYRLALPLLSPGSNASHECLYMIITRSGFEPEALETFRTDEVIDYDGDGAKEFSDGWGSPIALMRWSPGLTSPIQANDPINAHDPLDPLERDATAFALVPLIYSAGPDEVYGLVTMSGTTVTGPTSGWASLPLTSICSLTVAGASTASWNGRLPGSIDPSNANAAIDNITNHDLSRK